MKLTNNNVAFILFLGLSLTLSSGSLESWIKVSTPTGMEQVVPHAPGSFRLGDNGGSHFQGVGGTRYHYLTSAGEDRLLQVDYFAQVTEGSIIISVINNHNQVLASKTIVPGDGEQRGQFELEWPDHSVARIEVRFLEASGVYGLTSS